MAFSTPLTQTVAVPRPGARSARRAYARALLVDVALAPRLTLVIAVPVDQQRQLAVCQPLLKVIAPCWAIPLPYASSYLSTAVWLPAQPSTCPTRRRSS